MLEFFLKYAPLISAVATSLGLLSLYFIYRQLKDSKSWNKLHFTYTFFPDSQEFEELEIFLDERLNFWHRDNALTPLEVKALIGKEEISKDEVESLCQKFDEAVKKENCAKELIAAGRKLKIYINQIEYYCAAVSAGIVDSETAKNIYSYKFRRAYEKSLPWIEEVRKLKNEPGIFIEITKTLNKWFPAPEGQKSKY